LKLFNLISESIYKEIIWFSAAFISKEGSTIIWGNFESLEVNILDLISL
jgi:hypothetical protein